MASQPSNARSAPVVYGQVPNQVERMADSSVDSCPHS